MITLGHVAQKIRSKNAGPFWLTLDVFCGSAAAFMKISERLDIDEVADLFQISASDLKRFDLTDLNVIKLSMPRPAVQGTASDRDMHGASYAQILSEMPM
jgi:hypothetical protein